jgi:hypothetical protein
VCHNCLGDVHHCGGEAIAFSLACAHDPKDSFQPRFVLEALISATLLLGIDEFNKRELLRGKPVLLFEKVEVHNRRTKA